MRKISASAFRSYEEFMPLFPMLLLWYFHSTTSFTRISAQHELILSVYFLQLFISRLKQNSPAFDVLRARVLVHARQDSLKSDSITVWPLVSSARPVYNANFCTFTRTQKSLIRVSKPSLTRTMHGRCTSRGTGSACFATPIWLVALALSSISSIAISAPFSSLF